MEWLKKNWKNIVLLFFIVVICILTISLSKSNNSLYNAETNIKALTDSIHSYKLENGELLTSKYGLIVEKEELTKHLEITEKEKKDLEKKLNSSLAYIAELKTSVRIDTIHTIDSIFIDKNDVTNINFKYTDEWVYLDGSTKFKDIKDSKTTINTININTPLKVGLTEDNQFFATTPNPYVKISDIYEKHSNPEDKVYLNVKYEQDDLRGAYEKIVDLETNNILTSKELESFLPPKKEDK